MYPQKTKESKSSYFDIIIDFTDFMVNGVKSFKSTKTFLMFLHKNFHF